MSMNNALETFLANWIKGGAHDIVNAWRLVLTKAGAAGDYEADTDTDADYTGYAPVTLAASDLTVSGNQVLLNAGKSFPKNTGATQTVKRVVLEFSTNGGSTFPYHLSAESDLDQVVPTNGTPSVAANTGFVFSLD